MATPDVVTAVHEGMRRRRRRQRYQQAGAAVSVMAVAVTGTLLLQQGPHRSPTTLDAAVPTGFLASDLTFLSTTQGYALGTTPCQYRNGCTIVLKTENGAVGWERRKAPSAGVATSNIPSAERCDLSTCVTQLRFAKASDGRVVGYAFGPDFAVTRDDAQTWANDPVEGRVQAVEAAQFGVVRVVSLPGGTQRVERAEVGTEDWTEVLSFQGAEHEIHLRRQGARLVLTDFLFGRSAGVSEIRVSDDGGSTWRTGARDLCAKGEALASAALGKEQQVVVLCSQFGAAYVRQSRDDGTTFGPPLPVQGLNAGAWQLVALPGRWLVAADDDNRGVRTVLSTSDEGRTWQRVVREKGPTTLPISPGYLDNSNSTTAWWVGRDGRYVWRTEDAGDTWDSATFR